MTDNGYPNPQFDTATAIITIDRDLNVPVFTSNARYAVTIDETTNIGSSILNVQASRLNLVVCIFIKDTSYGKLINMWIIVCISILNFLGTNLLWINWRLSCPEFLHGTKHQWCHQSHSGSASRQPASELLLGEILTLAIFPPRLEYFALFHILIVWITAESSCLWHQCVSSEGYSWMLHHRQKKPQWTNFQSFDIWSDHKRRISCQHLHPETECVRSWWSKN